MGKDSKKPALRNSIVVACVLFVVDAFCLSQGVIAVLALLVVCLWLIPRAIYLFMKKREKFTFAKAIVYSLMSVLVILTIRLNNHMAKNRADELIEVIHRYKQENHHYPGKLSDLSPKYIDAVPRAKYTVFVNEFHYHTTGDDAVCLTRHRRHVYVPALCELCARFPIAHDDLLYRINWLLELHPATQGRESS